MSPTTGIVCLKPFRRIDAYSSFISLYVFSVWVQENSRADPSFGGLVVSMLASGTQDRGFKPGRSRRIFSGVKSSACLPSVVKGRKAVCPVSQICGT
jgi:hypothetical protein